MEHGRPHLGKEVAQDGRPQHQSCRNFADHGRLAQPPKQPGKQPRRRNDHDQLHQHRQQDLFRMKPSQGCGCCSHICGRLRARIVQKFIYPPSQRGLRR